MALYGTGDFIHKLALFMALPIYTRVFTPEEYGTWSFVATAVGLLGGVLILGGDSAFSLFFFEAKSETEKQLVTSTWFGFLFAWSVAVIFLCLPFTSVFSTLSFGTGKHAALFALTLLASPLTLINTMCGQALRCRFQPRLFMILSVCSSLLSVGFSLFGVVVLELGLRGVMGGVLLAALFMLPIRLWTVRDLLRPMFSIEVLRRLLAFGVPLVPSGLAYWVFAVSDRVLLGRLSTLEQVGLYTLANQVTIVLSFINGAWGQAWSPHAVKVYVEQRQVAPVFFGRVLTYILCGFGLLSVVLTTFSKEVLMILSTPSYYPAGLAIGPLALGFVAYSSTQVTALGISFSKKTQYFAIFSWIAALMNLGVNVLLIPKWGMMAASWTTFGAYLFLTITYMITSHRLWPIVIYEKKRLLVVGGLTLIFTLTAPILQAFPIILGIIIKSFYCSAFVGLLFLLKGLDGREWEAFLTVMRGRSVAARAM
jgi:O-antigen/teichoic acid export membrane protein